jgi:hypothetical protein
MKHVARECLGHNSTVASKARNMQTLSSLSYEQRQQYRVSEPKSPTQICRNPILTSFH